MVKNTIKNLEFLFKPRNIAFMGAALVASSLPNTSFGNVQERVQRGLAAITALEGSSITQEQRWQYFDIAENELARALSEEPNNCDALSGYGRHKWNSQNFEKAIPHLEKAAEQCGTIDSLERLISCYINVGDLDSAEKYITVLLNKNKKSANAYSQLGVVKWLKKDYKGAIAECEKAVAIDPKMFTVFNNMASGYQELGDLENAKYCAEQGIAVNPSYSNGHFRLGLVYKQMGNMQEAVKEFRKSVELAPDATNFKEELDASEKVLKNK